MHEARHHHYPPSQQHLPLYPQQQQPQQGGSSHGAHMASSSSSSSSVHNNHQHQQQQHQQSFQQQLRQHHQPPPLSHGLTSHSSSSHGGRGASPPHPGGVPPHLPISGSSVSYSDDNGSVNLLTMPSFDDSSSHLDLPSLLQANGNNGGRDMRLGVTLDHHNSSAGGHHPYPQLHHHHHQQHHQQHHGNNHHHAWSSSHSGHHSLEPLPVRGGTESKPQPSPVPSPDEPQLSTVTAPKKRSAGDALGGGGHQLFPGIEEAPRPVRTKKKKTVEKNSNSIDDNDILDDEYGDGLDCDGGDGGGGGGGGKDVKRQMRLVKNRQAAQQFRKRQKLYIQDLERRCSSLSAQNASYGAKVELLTTENRLVKEQLEYLRSFVSQAVQVSLTPAAVAGGPLQMPGPLSAALAGAIPASLLGIGSPLAGALSSSLPSQTGPGRPTFASLQPPGAGSSLGAKMPSFPSSVSLAPSSAARGGSAAGGYPSSSLLPSLQPSSSYARNAPAPMGMSSSSDLNHRPL